MRRWGPDSRSDVSFSSRSVTPSRLDRTLITAIAVSEKSASWTAGGGASGGDPPPPPPHEATNTAARRAAAIPVEFLMRRMLVDRPVSRTTNIHRFRTSNFCDAPHRLRRLPIEPHERAAHGLRVREPHPARDGPDRVGGPRDLGVPGLRSQPLDRPGPTLARLADEAAGE